MNVHNSFKLVGQRWLLFQPFHHPSMFSWCLLIFHLSRDECGGKSEDAAAHRFHLSAVGCRLTPRPTSVPIFHQTNSSVSRWLGHDSRSLFFLQIHFSVFFSNPPPSATGSSVFLVFTQPWLSVIDMLSITLNGCPEPVEGSPIKLSPGSTNNGLLVWKKTHLYSIPKERIIGLLAASMEVFFSPGYYLWCVGIFPQWSRWRMSGKWPVSGKKKIDERWAAVCLSKAVFTQIQKFFNMVSSRKQIGLEKNEVGWLIQERSWLGKQYIFTSMILSRVIISYIIYVRNQR